MTGFDTLRERLLEALRGRIHNGEATERGLARSAGISQPHVHNLLKGIRSLNTATSDQLLARLGMDILGLLDTDELRRALFLRLAEREAAMEVPVLKTRLGPGLPWPAQPGEFECVKVPVTYLARVRRPAVARLSDDPSMEPVLAAGDLVLLDGSEASLASPDPGDLFAVQREKDVVIRWVRRGRSRSYLISARDRDEPHRWDAVERPPAALLRARVIPLRWMRRPEVLYDPLLPPRDRPREPARRSSSN